jgi:hypothetical protein
MFDPLGDLRQRLRPVRAGAQPALGRAALIASLAPALLTLAACGGDASRNDAAVDMADTVWVQSSDAELRLQAARMLPELARRSGMALVEPVRIERRSRAELERYLSAKLTEELPEARARDLVEAYALLGLVSDEIDLRELLLGVYLEQVAGFYDPDSTALFVLDDQPPEVLEPLLLHELVHAVQDQTVDLEVLTDPALDADRRTAAQAAIEGHATLVMLEFITQGRERQPVDIAQVPEMADMLRPALEGAREQYPALAAAPKVLQEGLLFPYLEGASFVLKAWQTSPDRAAVLQQWLPVSTEQVLDPTRVLGDTPDPPLEVRLDPVRFSDVLGQAELRIWLEQMGLSLARAEGWGGDRFGLSDDGGLVLATAWDAVADRDEFIAAVTPVLDRLPSVAQLEAVEIEGVPLALLRIGNPDGQLPSMTVGVARPSAAGPGGGA